MQKIFLFLLFSCSTIFSMDHMSAKEDAAAIAACLLVHGIDFKEQNFDITYNQQSKNYFIIFSSHKVIEQYFGNKKVSRQKLSTLLIKKAQQKNGKLFLSMFLFKKIILKFFDETEISLQGDIDHIKTIHAKLFNNNKENIYEETNIDSSTCNR